MAPRRKLCILSSPEEDETDLDDLVSPPLHHTTTQFSLQNMTLNSSSKSQPNQITQSSQQSQRDRQSQRNQTSISPIPLNISSSDDEEGGFMDPKSASSNGLVNGNVGVFGEFTNLKSPSSNGLDNGDVFVFGGSVNRQNSDGTGVNSSGNRYEGSGIRDFRSPKSDGLGNVDVVRYERSVIRDFESRGGNEDVNVSVFRCGGSVLIDARSPNSNVEVNVSGNQHGSSGIRDAQSPKSHVEVNVSGNRQERSGVIDAQSLNRSVEVNVSGNRHERSGIIDAENLDSNGAVDVNVFRHERSVMRDFQNPIEVNANVNQHERSVFGDSTNLQNRNSNGEVNANVNVIRDERSGIGGGVDLFLRNMGLNLRREWLESCMNGLSGGVNGFERLDDCRKAKMCFEQFLKADMNCCGGGVLPENVNSLHLVELKGPFILQVDEIVNISCAIRTRYQKAAPGTKRCLKLSMTDGVQRVFGMEYRPIGALDVFAPAGMKVAISNVCVRHGLLMLVPEVFAVLGGVVEELEAARERLVKEVNKPPRGKRTRTGVIPPLVSRATLAAWPQENANAPVETNNFRVDGSGHFQTAEQGTVSDTPASGRTREHTVLPNRQEAGTTSFSASDLDGAALHTPAFRVPASVRGGGNIALRSHQEFGTTSFSASAFNGAAFHTTASHAPASDRAREHTVLQSHQENGTTSFSASSLNGAVLHTPTHRNSDRITEDASSRRHSMGTNYSAEAMDVDEINMTDELEFPYILSGEKEAPFTYLTSLSTEYATMEGKVRHVQGMIKGVLIGVKRFQYKQTDKYELQVYVDDGSLISEILVDHNLVERIIGHPPRLVATGIESRDDTMKKKLTQFQKFLANFEGMMFIQFNEASPLPLVMEMNEGCTLSDAWKLLRRLQSPTSTRQPQHCQFNPIELSP